MKNRFIISALASVAVLGLASCDDYLDINSDPNSPAISDITPSMLMPGVEMQLAATYGSDLRTIGGYLSQHYSQYFGTSNYLDFSQFQVSATRGGYVYDYAYARVLSNLKDAIEKAEESEEWGTYLACTTLRAFTFQMLIDCFGETPYSDAIDANNLTPRYDDGQTVYDGIIAELDNALSKVNGGESVCTNFLFPGDKADSWIKFANALKLRILMRESGVKDVKSQLASLIEEGNFPVEDVQFDGCFRDESGSWNPIYANDDAPGMQKNIIANLAIVGTMLQKDNEGNVIFEDGRLASYFNANEKGDFTGSISGTNFSTSNAYKAAYWCRPAIGPTSPVSLMSVAEVEFFISEYYARYGSAAEAEAHYVAAVEASFAAVEADGADDFIAQFPYDNANYKKCIGIAKWIDLAGYNSFEAWCELRRLRYPEFGAVKGSDLYDLKNDASYKPEKYKPGTLYSPISVFGQVGDGKILERFPYAEKSSSRNSNTPEFPGYTVPVFWAK